MKPLFVLVVNFSLLLLVGVNHARKYPAEEYWKEVMKEQTMPEAIRGIIIIHNKLHEEDPSVPDSDILHRFSNDFDTRENAIIYHGRHGEDHKEIISKSFTEEDDFESDHDHPDEEDREIKKYD